jgi:hypothetical protein
MSDEQYLNVQSQVMLFGALVRGLDLNGFIERAERADAVGALLAPSHWIAGKDKLELVLTLARKLRAFQAALPSEAEAERLDAEANALRVRLGV